MLQQVYSQQVFHLEPVHGEDILEEAIEKLEPMFQRRVRAVEVIFQKILMLLIFIFVSIYRKLQEKQRNWHWLMSMKNNHSRVKCAS